MGFILGKEKVLDLDHETNDFQKKTQIGEVDNKKDDEGLMNNQSSPAASE